VIRPTKAQLWEIVRGQAHPSMFPNRKGWWSLPGEGDLFTEYSHAEVMRLAEIAYLTGERYLELLRRVADLEEAVAKTSLYLRDVGAVSHSHANP
jgi:hypothetical protein